MPTAWTSVCAGLAVHLFEGRVTIDDMDIMQSVGTRWNVEHPGKRVELVVVLPSDTRLSQEERARMARLIKQGEVYRSASATVILAEGLLASMQRSMLTGMMMLAPAPHPAKVFGSLSDASRWLLPHAQTVCTPSLTLESFADSLTEHVAQFRARPS